jgi:hypothetical protein
MKSTGCRTDLLMHASLERVVADTLPRSRQYCLISKSDTWQMILDDVMLFKFP